MTFIFFTPFSNEFFFSENLFFCVVSSIQELAGYDGAHTVVAIQTQDMNNI